MEKLVKIIVLGRVTEGGHLDANHRDAIAVNVDPMDRTMRSSVLKAIYQRLPWLAKVPDTDSHLRMYWIGKCLKSSYS